MIKPKTISREALNVQKN